MDRQAELRRSAVSTSVGVLDRSAPVYIAGHRGLVGSALLRRFQAAGFTNLLVRQRSELDLTDRAATFDFIRGAKPEVVIDAAARVGGILANSTYPADFLSENLQIQVNLLDAAMAARVPRLLFLGSSCIYPKFAPQPIPESALLTGPLERTNDAYAIAKIAGILQVQAVRRQYGLSWISAMPTNLYGPGDNFSATGSHLLPALIRRYDEAKASGAPEVTNWGTGKPRRELLHVDDLASASLFLLEHYDGPDHINVGTGMTTASRRSPRWWPQRWATTAKLIGIQVNRTARRETFQHLRFTRGRMAARNFTARAASSRQWPGIEQTPARHGNECGGHAAVLIGDAMLACQKSAIENYMRRKSFGHSCISVPAVHELE